MAVSKIEHAGVVARTEPDRVYVKITSQSACGSCGARRACGLAEAQEKIVEVGTSAAGQYAPGEQVTVGIRRGAGMMAVVLGYVGALVVLLGVLIAARNVLDWSEGRAALGAVAGVAGYYVVLWLFRKKIENKIHFTITKNH